MDRHGRLVLRLIVISCSLYALAIRSESYTKVSKKLTRQYSGSTIMTTDNWYVKKGMPSLPITFRKTDDISTTTSSSRVTSFPSDVYMNASQRTRSFTGNNNFTNSDSDSNNHFSDATKRNTQFFELMTRTSAFMISTLIKDLHNQMVPFTDEATQSYQRLTGLDTSSVSVLTENFNNDRTTERGMQILEGLHGIAAHNTVDSVSRDVYVTVTPKTPNQENNSYRTQSDSVPSIDDSFISTPDDLMTSTSIVKSRVSIDIGLSHSINANPTSGIQATAVVPKQDICHQYGGCDLVPGPIWFCHCDDLCEEYDDCCRDYVFSKKNRKHSYTCVGIEDNVSNIWGIQAISNCPENYTNTSTVRQCSISSFTSVGPPVLDLQDKSRVYRNKYCAICNGANAVQLGIAFTISPIVFQEIDNAINLTDDDFQDYLFRVASYRYLIPENANVRYCLKNLVRNDNDVCNRYSNPILFKEGNRMYRNVFCRESFGTSSSVCAYNFMESSIAILMRSSVLSAMKLTILFSFSQNNAVPTVDPCREWSKQNDENCAHLTKYINAFLDCDFNIQFLHNTTIVEIMQSILLTLFVKQLDGFITVGRPTMVLVNKDLTLVYVKVGCNIQKQVFSHEFSEIKRKINHQRIDISEENSVNDRWLISNKPLDLKTNDLVINDNLRPLREFVSKKRNYYMQYGIYLPDMVWSELCDDVRMMLMRSNNGSLIIINVTCQSKLLEQQNTGILATLTLVFTSVSCASLVVMIVINRLLHLHHEATFANLEILGMTTILSNIFLLIGQTAPYINSWVCYTISVLSHYLWLAVFSFKSLAVMHIVKVLMKLKERRMHTKESNYRKRRKLVGIGLIIPLLFVAPAIFVDQHCPMYFSPGYVNEAICFPIKYPGNLIFFTGPVLAMIVINAACIIQIMIRVHLVKVAAINIRQSPTFSEAKIFLRLLSISGVLWITGIMATYFKSEWLEYVFTVLCGLQGLFLAIANLTTKRINCFRGVNVHTNET